MAKPIELPAPTGSPVTDGLQAGAAAIAALDAFIAYEGRAWWPEEAIQEARVRINLGIVANARPPQDELAFHRHNLTAVAARLGLPTNATWGDVADALDKLQQLLEAHRDLGRRGISNLG